MKKTKPFKRKLRVGILFGGKSAEHEVSLLSAKNVIAALDKEKYEPVLIGIDKQGHWHLNRGSEFLLNEKKPALVKLNAANAEQVTLIAGNETGELVTLENGGGRKSVDIIFPVMHGTFGEDGTVQGLLKLMDVPFVGPSVLGSAVGMDKDVAKRLLREAGILVARSLTVRTSDKKTVSFSSAKKYLGLPLFIKPANLGSSVGVSKAKNEKEFKKALALAFEFDTKVLIEEFIQGREIECSVLGNEHPIASVPGEVKPTHEFYSYEAKYIDENGAALEIPAKLPQAAIKKIQTLAVKAFQVLECEGMSRVDFFMTKSGKLYLNEINTIPGFTKISMYPKLWEASGIGYGNLIDRLITLALERHTREKSLRTSF